MRPSQYNLIENHGERTLVMNAKTGAILSLDKQHAEKYVPHGIGNRMGAR